MVRCGVGRCARVRGGALKEGLQRTRVRHGSAPRAATSSTTLAKTKLLAATIFEFFSSEELTAAAISARSLPRSFCFFAAAFCARARSRK